MTKSTPELMSERVWIVVGRHGAYYGTYHTRKDAKTSHAHDFYDSPQYSSGRALTPEQQAAWDKCAANGDRVVRATLVWEK